MTVTIGGTNYPSYTTVAGADAYLAADVQRAARWALLQPDAKARAIVSATRVLTRQAWCAAVPSLDAPPVAVSDATAVLAADLAAKPALASNPGGGSNVKSAKAGSASVEFFESTSGTAPPLPPEVWAMLTSASLLGCAPDPAATDNDAPFFSGTTSDCDIWPYGGCYGFDDDGRRGGF